MGCNISSELFAFTLVDDKGFRRLTAFPPQMMIRYHVDIIF
jgi:hypothetical protein